MRPGSRCGSRRRGSAAGWSRRCRDSGSASRTTTDYALMRRNGLFDPGGRLTGARVERRLAAILAADVAGYSRLMNRDEERTLADLKLFRQTLVDPRIAEHRGRIVKTTGDGMLAEFASA